MAHIMSTNADVKPQEPVLQRDGFQVVGQFFGIPELIASKGSD